MEKINMQRRLVILGAGSLLLPTEILAAQCVKTAAQIEGPFYPERWFLPSSIDLTNNGKASGEVHVIQGRVVDQFCQPLKGVQVDLWQANHWGRYAHRRDRNNPAKIDKHFTGQARLVTDTQGRFMLTTIKPGSYPAGPGWIRPPHLHFKIWWKGQESLTTQTYFSGETLNEDDLILGRLTSSQQDNVILHFEHAKHNTGKVGKLELRISI